MLTLRRIYVLAVKHMRKGGHVEEALVGFAPMTRLEVLLDDLRRTVIALQQKPGSPWPEAHPDRTRLTAGQRQAHQVEEDERARISRERAAERKARQEGR